MTQVHFTLNKEDIQTLIETSVKDDLSKNILQATFNQLMEQERTDYLNAGDYERSSNRVSQRNGYYERDYTTRVGRSVNLLSKNTTFPSHHQAIQHKSCLEYAHPGLYEYLGA